MSPDQIVAELARLKAEHQAGPNPDDPEGWRRYMNRRAELIEQLRLASTRHFWLVDRG